MTGEQRPIGERTAQQPWYGATWKLVAMLLLGLVSFGITWIILVVQYVKWRRFGAWARTALRGVAVIEDVTLRQGATPDGHGGTIPFEELDVRFTVHLPERAAHSNVNIVPAEAGGYTTASFPPGSHFFCLVDRNDPDQAIILTRERAPDDLREALEVAESD
ncbi:MAG: hypothetical protein ACT4PI_07300 [Actinomycetota bacterium]